MSGRPDPSTRQVMVNLGNRTVLFGQSANLPDMIRFTPDDDREVFPSVADESEVAEERIVRTLRVSGFESTEEAPSGAAGFDLEALDKDGHKILIDIKVRERDPKDRDLDAQVT